MLTWLKRCGGVYFTHCWHYEAEEERLMPAFGVDCRIIRPVLYVIYKCCRCGKEQAHKYTYDKWAGGIT